jgi:hypothetical protein
MIVVAILEGYSASSRSRTIIDVYEQAEREAKLLNDQPIVVLGEKSSILRSRSRKMRKFITQHAYPTSKLICIGKSYGAKQMIDRVINKIPFSTWKVFSETYLITVDPCWPKLWDWTPNRNADKLHSPQWINRTRNIFLFAPKRMQAGAALVSTELFYSWDGQQLDSQRSIGLEPPYTHYSIIEAPEVKREIIKSLELASR